MHESVGSSNNTLPWFYGAVLWNSGRESDQKGCPDSVGHSKYLNGEQFQDVVKGLYQNISTHSPELFGRNEWK